MKCWLSAIVILLSFASACSAREVVDMEGRKVVIPDVIHKVYAPSPFGSYMIYALAPEMTSGIVFNISESDQKYLPSALQGLPVLGAAVSGMGVVANPEQIIQSKPDLLIVWKVEEAPTDQRIQEFLNKVGIPYVVVRTVHMNEYPAAVRFVGNLLGRKQRAETLAQSMSKSLSTVSAAVNSTPQSKRPKVYYAEGPDGLSTECSDSFHVELLRLLGDLNVHRCHSMTHMGMDKLSLEQVMLYNPDVILAQEKFFTDKVYSDPQWRQLKAVQQHRVYLVPRKPLNWFDRPPSFMRFLCAEWLASVLYPGKHPVDMVQKTKSFYSTFLSVNLSDQEARELLRQP